MKILVTSPRIVSNDQLALRKDVSTRLLRNSTMIVAARVMTAVASLVAVPVIVAKLGIGGFGIWEALVAFGSLITIVQTPIGGTLLWRISMAYGARNSTEARRLVRIGVSLVLVLMVVLIPTVWLARGGVVRLLNISADCRETASLMIVCLVGVAVLGIINEIRERCANYT